MNISKLLRLAVILLTIQLFGCSSQGQLERVAKDWCMTIRASQVIPVYPLTEDLEPGDVFLVQTCVPRQAEQYKKKGFLPLDMHMVRLDIPHKEFNEFYDGFYGLDPNSQPYLPPHIWQDRPKSNNDSIKPNNPKEPNDPNTRIDSNGQKKNEPSKHLEPTNWHKAPRAGFPTYTFKVERGAAGAAALPIKGIPVAMSLLGTDKATGSVTIKDSYTYGVPYDDLSQKLTTWAQENKDLLKDIRTGVKDAEPFPDRLWRILTSPFFGYRERTIYLRIISRVYLTGSLTVSMTNTSAAAVKAATKSFEDMNLPDLSSAADVNDNTKRIKALNESLSLKHLDTKRDAGGVGAALNISWATFRSISIDERFDRPLVIGYLAFDLPVLKGGDLGTPIATLNQISNAPVPTKAKPLSPKSTQILTGLLGQMEDALSDLADSNTDDANTARTHLQNLRKAARRILFDTSFPSHRYEFIKNKNELIETQYLKDDIPGAPGLSVLIVLWEAYKEDLSAIKQALSRIKSAQPLSIKYSDRSDPVVDPNETDFKRLARIYDKYHSRRSYLEIKMRSAPEVINAVNYYTSLFFPK